MKKTPLISVIMATYNHAPYVEQAIKSVLAQKNVHIEFLIMDDGSKDKTRDVVAAIKDERIQFFPNIINRGACIVTNELIGIAKGKYIALINSDDFWHDESKLEKQLFFLETHENVGACFGKARFVDQNGLGIFQINTIFEVTNKSKAEWLRYFFRYGNCLCHPTILIRKECYDNLGGYDNRFRQLPDFDMWVRLIKKYDIHIFEEEFISFRILPGEQASSNNPENTTRLMNEYHLIGYGFFDGVESALLEESFNDIVRRKTHLSHNHLEIEKTFCLLYAKSMHSLSLIGLKKLYRALGDPIMREILLNDYQYSDILFHKQLAEINLLVPKKKKKLKHKIRDLWEKAIRKKRKSDLK